MPTPTLDRARALAVAQDFGPEALGLNARLVAANPEDVASRTRLGRCYLEAGRLDEAEAEYREVLRRDPRNRIAAGGIEAIERLRHPEPVAVPRARVERRAQPRRESSTRPAAGQEASDPPDAAPQIFNGFGPDVFVELRRCPRGLIQARFAPRVIDFVRRVNVLQAATEMAGIREAGKRQLFRLGRSDVHVIPAQWSMSSFGERTEPQVNIAMSAAGDPGAGWLRIGVGFNLADRGDGGADREQAHAHFTRFQQFLTSSRRSLFLGWMVREDGRIQYNHGVPRADLREPSKAASFIVEAKPERTDWLFFGKWLTLDRPQDLAILADPVELVRVIDRALTGLLPLWRTFWE
ncbi:MAG: tetratricopeptide repeat protein [Bacteroidales bacterium]